MHEILKAAHLCYNKINHVSDFTVLKPSQFKLGIDESADLIYNTLIDDKPCMIARLGSTETAAIVNYLGVKEEKHSIWKYISGEVPQWWWEKSIITQMKEWSGFFPSNEASISQFAQLMLKDMSEIDILGSWQKQERYLSKQLHNANKIHIMNLEPFWSTRPWSKALENKKILVIHPFNESIEYQYKRRELLFTNKDILPYFSSLKVIKAVQSLGGNSTDFKSWFEALNWMKSCIDKEDYDIALIGCGAYGLPLAAHVKRKGKKAIHLGGVLQLLFGIRGRRWEDENYGVKEWEIEKGLYSNLMNNNWIRPLENRPLNSNKVEGNCYW